MHVRDAERVRTQIRDGHQLHHLIASAATEAIATPDLDRLAAVLQKTLEQIRSPPKPLGCGIYLVFGVLSTAFWG
jgi:predicted ATP-grasp superfamily ATP-dependent carboligase